MTREEQALLSRLIVFKRIRNILWLVFSFMLCAACVATPSATPLPTDTLPVPTASITPTIIWFPSTATPTPFPTPIVTPTVDLRPNTGQVLLEDDFSDPNAWTLSQTDVGSVALGKNELSIAIGESNAYIYTIREQPAFTDFYLDITAETSLCRDFDEYGILYHYSSSGDYYRFALSCNGSIRLDRVLGGQASSPQPWLFSGAVPPGAPAISTLGISVIGSDMSFFVNGEYQFSVHDPSLPSGSLGLFARSTNNKAVTVSYYNLTVYEVIP